jgi:hypothetical protein
MIVGEIFVLQQMPFAITLPDPSSVIVPPLSAVVPVTFDISDVVKVGTSSFLQE